MTKKQKQILIRMFILGLLIGLYAGMMIGVYFEHKVNESVKYLKINPDAYKIHNQTLPEPILRIKEKTQE